MLITLFMYLIFSFDLFLNLYFLSNFRKNERTRIKFYFYI